MVLPTFPTISVIPETMVPAPEVQFHGSCSGKTIIFDDLSVENHGNVLQIHANCWKCWYYQLFRRFACVESLKTLLLPTFPTISMIPETTVPAFKVSPNSLNFCTFGKPTLWTICLWGIMENVGFSNNTSGSRVKSAFSTICLCGIMENFGFTNISNNLHGSGNYGSGSRTFSKFMEIVGHVGKTVIFDESFVGNHGKLSMIPETVAPAQVSPNSWRWLKILDSPAMCTDRYFKTVLPKYLRLSTSYVLRQCVFAK